MTYGKKKGARQWQQAKKQPRVLPARRRLTSIEAGKGGGFCPCLEVDIALLWGRCAHFHALLDDGLAIRACQAQVEAAGTVDNVADTFVGWRPVVRIALGHRGPL